MNTKRTVQEIMMEAYKRVGHTEAEVLAAQDNDPVKKRMRSLHMPLREGETEDQLIDRMVALIRVAQKVPVTKREEFMSTLMAPMREQAKKN